MSQQPPTGAPGPIPDPGPRQDPAMLHVTEQTRTYPCPNCGGTLAYDPEPAALKCLSCGTVVPVASDVAHPDVIAKRDLASTMADLARLQANAKTRVTGDKEVVCQNCGGRIMFSGTLTAVRCPFCNTPIQRNDVQDSPTRLPIDGVLPLRISERDARQRIEQWINSRRFAPNAFKKYRELGSFTSIYLPYFSYDAATGYAQATANESEPTPGDITQFTNALKHKRISMLILNPQEANATTRQITDAAKKADVPIIEISEQMPSNYNSLLDWMSALVNAIGHTS